jgi:restriction system protein
MMTAGFLTTMAIASFVQAHPVLAMSMFLLLLGGAVGAAILWWKRRQHQLAETARQEQIYALRAQEIETYLTMNPKEFEEALAYLCERDDCQDAQVVGKAGDLGADVTAVTPRGERLVIQAKRYARGNLVTGPDLQKFGGTCFQVHQAQVAAVVTTSGFTKQAREYAAHMGIRLFDHDALGGWASKTGPTPWDPRAS